MATTVRFDKLESTYGKFSASATSDGKVYRPGTIAQVVTKRSDAQTLYSSPISGNGTTITDLSITITPKFGNSLLVCKWMINGESHHDNVILIHKDGLLSITQNEEGYNNTAGNSRWSGILAARYDMDNNTTPTNMFLQYMATVKNTNAITFSPAVRATAGTAYTFALNRTLESTGADYREAMVSTGTIWEIIQ